MLPILQRLSQGPRGCVRALIIAPTRELAEQIHDTTQGLGKQTRLRSVTVYGGVNMSPQIQKLRGKAEIVVACPGRLLDHIRQKTVNLSHIEVLVLDEADRMFDMGFLPDIRKILKHLPAHRQTLLFSATMPDDIKHLAHDILRNPVTVQINHTMPLTTVSHALYPVEHHHKKHAFDEASELRRYRVGTHIYTHKTTSYECGAAVEKAGHIATSLQGNMSQNQRQQHSMVFVKAHSRYWSQPILPPEALTFLTFHMSLTSICLTLSMRTRTGSDAQAVLPKPAMHSPSPHKMTTPWCALLRIHLV